MIVSTDLRMIISIGRFGIDHVDVGIHDVTWMLMMCPTGRAKKHIDVKISPDGLSRSMYARAGEICFTLKY